MTQKAVLAPRTKIGYGQQSVIVELVHCNYNSEQKQIEKKTKKIKNKKYKNKVKVKSYLTMLLLLATHALAVNS